jgi:alanyl-tRNA synthetase
MKAEYKIIADHLRSSSFLIADGVLPSNEGRGYVLRRIMRRAMRQLHKLGAKEASMFKLVDVLIYEMGAAYPELSRARAVIVETLKNEEEKFRETLEKGLKILDEEILKTKSTKFSGEIAFKLYDTYGFPLDLTQDILKEKNIEVDLDTFNREMENQRERARKSWSGSGEVAEEKVFFDLKEKFGETKFLGYENLKSKAKILAIYPNFLILDQTPFYATSGGQKGDDGVIGGIEISETKKFAGGLFAHFFSTQNCDLKVGSEITAEVNPKTRAARAANHSATHLMHKALKEVLGDSISQKGSNVDADYFTFDFNFNRAMTVEEVKKVEDLVNSWIKESSGVNTNLMALDKARESGAEALFGEKYDAEVRVVSMGKSIELCGGTHVSNTSEIEIFKIISEKSVASGIRRIEAKSGNSAKKYLDEQAEKLKNFVAELKEKIAKKDQEIGGEIEDLSNQNDPKILEEILKKKDKEIERLKKEKLLKNLGDLKAQKIGSVNLLAHEFEDADAKDVRDILNEIKARSDFSTATVFAFFGCKDGKVSVCISLTADLFDRFDSSKLIVSAVEAVGGKGGGGKKDAAMGGGIDRSGISKAIASIKDTISGCA